VHGDYRLDNLVVAGPGEPDAYAVRAVLDWEMATLGDPLGDLGLLVAYWDGPGTSDDRVVASIGPAAGLPPAAELVGRYAQRSGRDVSALAWYVAFGFFKIAVILEGIHYRYTRGQTVGPGFDRIGEVVPGLVDDGLAALHG
jgi:aminoglycoside phosphotransferase (APT) family kinase protein